jgi:hypothetical protein
MTPYHLLGTCSLSPVLVARKALGAKGVAMTESDGVNS